MKIPKTIPEKLKGHPFGKGLMTKESETNWKYKPTVFAKNIIQGLSEGYLLYEEDVLRLNMVGLAYLAVKNHDEEMSDHELIKTAVERLTIDCGMAHHDPYEMFIDAGLFDAKLNKIDKGLLGHL